MSSEAELDGESMTVLFIIVCFTISLVAKELNTRFGIPYTPLLILFGILLGYQNFLGQITSAVDTLMLINPHAILTIFLPILIFESSFNARLPSLSTNFLQILTLIILVVIISFLLIACVLKIVIGYNDNDLSWWHALTLGTILSATDPVAVVALLKELGAPVHINTIIEMESLFNDGSAMVFYTIFTKFTTGLTMTISESIILFLRLAFGGIGMGITFAIAALLFLQFLNKGKTLFLHIIVVGSYSVFYVGEHIWGVSGLLAVVAFGLMLNKFMKDQMTNEQVHQAESIVTFIQLINESLLFFFAGIIVGYELGHKFLVNLQYTDWGYILVLFIFIILIRLIGISVFFPILTRTGEGFTFKELALSVWGGLRGALSIALALSVYHNFEVPEGRAKMLILFHTCGIAALTLVINGTTAKYLVEQIDLILNLRARRGFKALFLKQIKKVGIKTLRQLRMDSVFSMTIWKGVEEIVQFDQIDLERKYIKVGDICLIRTFKRKMDEQKSLYRYSILRHLMKFLDDDQHNGYFHQTIHSIIEEAVLQCCEDPYKPILIWERCSRSFRTYKLLKYLRQSPYFRIFNSQTQILFLSVLNDKFSLLDILQSILVKTIALQKNYDKFIGQEISVLEELQIELGLVEDEIQEIKNLHPDELTKLSQKDAAMKILRKQAHYLDGKMGNLIAENEGVQLRDELFQQFNNVQSLLSTMRLKSGMNLLLSAAFQGILESVEIERILYQKQSIILKQDQDIPFETDFFLILKGQVEETVFNHGNSIQLEYGPSSIIGLSKIVDKGLCITARAISQIAEVVHFSFNFNDVKFTKFLFQKSLPELLKIYSNVHCIQNMTTFELLNFANECDILLNQESIFPMNGGFILRGEFSCTGKAEQKCGVFQTIPPSNTMMQSSSLFNAVVLFKEGIAEKKTFRRKSVQNRVYPAQNFEDTVIEKNNESGLDKSVVVNESGLDKSVINNTVDINENNELIK